MRLQSGPGRIFRPLLYYWKIGLGTRLWLYLCAFA